MRRDQQRGRLLELVVMGVLVGVLGLEGCERYGGSCGEPDITPVPLPSGGFGPASAELETVGSGSPLLNGVFSHGAYEPWPSGEQGSAGQGGQAGGVADGPSPARPNNDYYSEYGVGDYIPSARLVIARAQGTVTRSYVDELGRQVVETWRIVEEQP